MEPKEFKIGNFTFLGNIDLSTIAFRIQDTKEHLAHPITKEERIKNSQVALNQLKKLQPKLSSRLSSKFKAEVKTVQKLPLQMQKQLAFGQLCKLFEFLADKKIYDLSQGHLTEWSPKTAALFTLSAFKQWKMQDVIRFAIILLFQKYLSTVSEQPKGKKAAEKGGVEQYLNQTKNLQDFKELLQLLSKIFEQITTKQPTVFDFSQAPKAEFLAPLFNLVPSIAKQVDVLDLPLCELSSSLTASTQALKFDEIFKSILNLHKEFLQHFNLFRKQIEKALSHIKTTSLDIKKLFHSGSSITFINQKKFQVQGYSGILEKQKAIFQTLSSGIHQLILFLEKQKKFTSSLQLLTSQDYLKEDCIQALDFKYNDLEDSSAPFKARLKEFISRECDRPIDYISASLTEEEQTEESFALLISQATALKQLRAKNFKQAALEINAYILDQFANQKITLDEIEYYNKYLFTRDTQFLFDCILNEIVSNKEISQKIKEHISSPFYAYPQWALDFLKYARSVLDHYCTTIYEETIEFIEKRIKEADNIYAPNKFNKTEVIVAFLEDENSFILNDADMLQNLSQYHEVTETSQFCFYLSNYLMNFQDRMLAEDPQQEIFKVLKERQETVFIQEMRQAKSLYEDIKSEINAILNGYEIFVESFFPLYHNARKMITFKALPKELVAYSWLLHIDKEFVRVKKQLPQPIYIGSSQVEQVDSDEEMATIVESQKPTTEFEPQKPGVFLTPLQAIEIATYKDVLLADERIHAHHLICTLDLIAEIKDIDAHRDVLASLLIHHLYQATEQLLTRTSSDPYHARHNLKSLYGKKDLAFSWINEGTINVRYPYSNLLFVKEAGLTPSFSLHSQTHSMTEQDFSELLGKAKSLVEFNLKRLKANSQARSEEMQPLYDQALEKLEKLLTAKSVEKKPIDTVNQPKIKATASSSKVIKHLDSLKSIIISMQQKFDIESASNIAEGRQKDVLVHLQRMQGLIDLISLYPKQQFLSLFESMFAIAAQYSCELLGSLETNLKGYFIDGHFLEKLIEDLKWETTLGVQTCQTLREMSRKKALDYPFGDIYRHPKRDTSNLEAFSELYELSWIARTEGEGYVSHKVKGANQSEKLLNALVKRWSNAIHALQAVATHVYQQIQKTV